jgi:hypothetical protein
MGKNLPSLILKNKRINCAFILHGLVFVFSSFPSFNFAQDGTKTISNSSKSRNIQFYIIGVSDPKFPSLNQAKTKLDTINCGLAISNWIAENQDKCNKIYEQPLTYNSLNYNDFKGFDAYQKEVFKKWSKNLQPALEYQRKAKDKVNEESIKLDKKESKKIEVPVYLISDSDLKQLKKLLNN